MISLRPVSGTGLATRLRLPRLPNGSRSVGPSDVERPGEVSSWHIPAILVGSTH